MHNEMSEMHQTEPHRELGSVCGHLGAEVLANDKVVSLRGHERVEQRNALRE